MFSPVLVKKRILPLLEPAIFSRYAHVLALLFCFFVNLSIGVSQTCVVLLVLYWLAYALSKPGTISFSQDAKSVLIPMFGWLLIAYLAALVGIKPLHALEEILSTTTYVVMPLAVYSMLLAGRRTTSVLIFKTVSYVFAFAAGQLVASAHTLASAIVGHEIRPRPPGALTESGQLVLILPMLAAVLILGTALSHGKQSASRLIVVIAAVSAAFVLAVWPEIVFSTNPQLQNILIAAAVAGLFLSVAAALYSMIRRLMRSPAFISRLNLSTVFYAVSFAVFVGTLIVNLKRGPWLGTAAALFFLGVLASKRVALLTIVVSICVVAFIGPVRDRFSHTAEHFAIGGGRMEMWQIGIELAQRFPLGLGPDNASVMRELDPSLPKLHRHMHNNLINIAAETGWLGMMVFIWWMLALISLGPKCWYRVKKSGDRPERMKAMLILAMSSAIFGWQAAGLAEYNFGDGEVRMIAFFYTGVMLALSRKST